MQCLAKTKKYCSRRCQAISIGTAFTRIERLIQKELDDLNIPYEPQKKLGNRYLIDFYLPHLKVAIECDGRGWHAMIETQIRDKKKNEFLVSQGIAVRRLYQDSIEKNPRQTLLKALANKEVSCAKI